MKSKISFLLVSLLFLTVTLSLTITPMIQAKSDKSGVPLLSNSDNPDLPSMPQDGEPGDPVVTGELGLNATVQVFPYDVDVYGIYLIQDDAVNIVTSVAVDHINTDRVTAKLSPDGYKVAYLVEYGGTGFNRLVVTGVDGLSSNILYESLEAGRYVTSFSWSHDSERLAYTLSRDPFAAGPDTAAAFEDPDLAINPLEETPVFDDPSVLTGEVWVTDLFGVEHQQLVDQGAMNVLGWAADDGGIVFTNAYVAEPEVRVDGMFTDDRVITPTTPFAGYVAIVETNAITTAQVTTVFTNTAVLSQDTATALYTDFYLLETGTGEQKLAGISTPEFFETVPMTDTMLLLADLPNNTRQFQTNALTFTPVLTNSAAIVKVTLSPDGERLAYMTEQSGGLWSATQTGLNHTAVLTEGLDTRDEIIWGTTNDTVAAAALDDYALSVLALDGTALGSLNALPSEDLLTEPLDAYDVRNYNVPFVHQLWDTPNWFNGRCACGPTSTAMALAFYNKISPNPITIPVPAPHTNDYGFYVPEKFGNFQSNVNPGGCPTGYGLYGRIVYDGGAWAWRIQDAVDDFGPAATFDGTATYNEVKAALDRGHLVILSTRLTSAGHIVLVRGYTSDNKLIVNDPYGNKLAGSYGQRRIDGADVRYTWDYMNSTGKWFVEVHESPPTPPAPPITHWKGDYFNNRDLAGQPALIRNDVNINFNWGGGAPGGGIPADNFSVRWTRTLPFDRGVYRFRTVTDDGVKLYVDNQLVINKWYDQGATAHESSDIFLDGGNHTIRMEYYEHGGGAVAQLSWQRVGSGSSGTGWSGQYFNNRTLSGSPTFTRNDDSIYFNWGTGGPGGGVGNDNFSVRWTKTLNIPRSGYYRLYARSDDGVRVRVDGSLRINAWYDQAPTTHASDWLNLSSGNHSVQVEYYERGGGAYIHLWLVPGFETKFYNNRTLSGNPSWSGYYTGVGFNWGSGGPQNTSVDNFSARWIGNAALSGGRYKFCTRTDDGVQLYVDGTRIINKWQDQAATTWCTDRDLSQGFHEIKMEYYERGGAASAELWWSKYSGGDALSASTMSLTEESTEFDMLALYGDSGYMGPLIEADLTSVTPPTGELVFLPLVVK